MYENDSRGFNCSDRQAESTDNYPTCSNCDALILALVARGPSDHVLSPCGCRVTETTARELAGGADQGRGVATDGGQSTDGTELGPPRCGVYGCENYAPIEYTDGAGKRCLDCFDADRELGEVPAANGGQSSTETEHEVRTDGGTDLATHEFTVRDDGSSIVYGPWDDEEWMLAVSTEDGERVRLLLGEAAMYELWTEVQHTPWPRKDEPRGTLSREIVEKVNGMDEDQLREVLETVDEVGGGER